MPEFGMTLFSITVASLFVSFALAATFLCFDVNPLSRAVRASCTGRVETVWNALRVFCVALGLVSQYVPAAICATVVLLMACALVNLHLEILPFHSPVENMVRGGIYACVAWIALASIIVSAAVGPKADAGSPSDSVVVLQWVLIGAVPFAFFFGVRAVQARQDRLLRDLKWLRREWEASPGYRANERRERRRASIISGNLEAVIMFKAVTSTGMPTITKNSTCDRFFDLEFGANRIFINGLHAHLLTRTLLLQRRKSDIPFVSYLLKRGLQEFPECRELVLLNLLLMRVFVRARAVNETTAHERFLDTLSDGAMLDHEYVLYASQRIIGQRDAGSSMGQDDISALQLLEFEMKFNKIKKLHRSCILALKAFWQIFCTHKRVFRKKAKYSEHLVDKVDDIVSCLQRIERASEGASEGYKALLDKFPRSVPLLHSYGSFCDVILNRAIQARQLMNSALLLESGPEEDVSSYAGQGHTLMHTLAIGDEENRQADQTAVKSTSSSSDGNHRARIDRFIASWKDVIMAKELADLRRLNWRILFATLMILVVCTIGFVLMDSVLYESTAHANIDLVDGSQLFRVNLFQSLFLIHSLVLADISNNTVEAASIQSHLNIISQGFAAAHLQSFQKATADVGDLYKSQTWQLFSPTGWITSFHSLWFLGNEFSSQVASASGMPTSEAAMWNNDITNLSPAMRAIVFLNENCFQNILPAFEQLGQAYIAQVVKFGQLTRTVIWISVSLNVILILLVAIYILRSLGSVVNNVQHDIVIMLLVLSTSRTSASKILAFYDRAERTIMDIDAEDENFVKLSTEDDELLATTTAGEDNRHNRDEMVHFLNNHRASYTVVGDKSSNCFGETMSQHKNLMDFPMIDKSGTHMSGTHMRISDDEIQAVPERNEFQGIRSIDIQQHPVLAIVSERLVCNNMKNNMNNNNMVKSSSSNSLVPEQRNHAALRIQSAPKSIQALRTLTAQKCPWYVRRPVHFVSLAVMLFLCIISVLYPARNVDDLVNIPAKQNQAGRRRFLHLACVHFARELVLYDGFSRLNAPELVAALQWSLYELRESDKAVRLGGTLGVIKGSEAGLGRTDHNSFVYSTGCPWRTNYSEGSFCSVQSRPNMLMHGLDGLMLTFYDACESILAKNLPEVLGNYLRFPQNFTQGTIQAEVNKANLDLLSSDPDAAFIMESFSGDLYQALEQVESIMKIEQDGIFNLFHSEGRLLYGVFVAQTCLLFYLVIFRKSILSCEKEIAKIKQFVQRLPAFLLEMQEAEEIHFFFKEREYARNQREDDENHVDLDLG